MGQYVDSEGVGQYIQYVDSEGVEQYIQYVDSKGMGQYVESEVHLQAVSSLLCSIKIMPPSGETFGTTLKDDHYFSVSLYCTCSHF